MRALDPVLLARACEVIEDVAATGGRIFAIGNGGSAAIAEHLSCDWTKGTHVGHSPTIDTQSLASNTALYSAIANDFGFESVFSHQLAMIAKPQDALVAISSSGNSANIIAACAVARERGLPVIGLTGFSGGKLREVADVALHVDVHNYGVVEDCHQAIMHIMAQFIAHRRDTTQ